jgi:Fe-S-cluster-containing dehydrogenase component/CRP-like cAMP-binding protein
MSSTATIAQERPVRWDHPLDPEMLRRDISWLLKQPPFAYLNPEVFKANGSLETILKHDARLVRYEPGDIVVREGDYGSSAFIVLRGSVRAFLVSLWEKQTQPVLSTDIWRTLQQFVRSKTSSRKRADQGSGNRRSRGRDIELHPKHTPIQSVDIVEGKNRIFLQDINAILNDYQSESLGVGNIFGEMAAITRTPHRFSVIADAPTVVLEIRWQGLRLLRRDTGFRSYLDERYRSTGLETHLRETPLLRFLDQETIQKVVEVTKLEAFGEMEWFSDFKDTKNKEVSSIIESEPTIAAEGTPARDLYLIRAGFARVSFQHGNGHRTTAYLGRGQMFGLEELSHSFLNPELQPLPYQSSLRALGFVDFLRIPRDAALSLLLPKVRRSELPSTIENLRYDAGGRVVPDATGMIPEPNVETPLIEFLVDQRIINGKQSMLIDLDRCTGCDECVKACASTHAGTPRFIRNGPQYGPLMFAHACMQCVDPVCMIGCPTGAIHRNSDSGVIAINPDTCIGCKTCSESCPYENIVMIQVTDKQGRAAVDRNTNLPILQASKCDLCQNHSTGPACQNACPHLALYHVDTSDSSALQSWLLKRTA